ncbi:hypothetical protein [Pseudarthrobacter sp. MM222]|uniref:hypothetical protein n=1 Tax=Pseudarthrobacter sp. MM222 TaxID=3018929 RepID=UPI0022202796|nr:hypothetical protein [Pseudarthrobacter sp. MM222]CAI3793006.1 hypothetical protein NKCBBBOE_00697 [Pseudarthrobacter sp. MM222]
MPNRYRLKGASLEEIRRKAEQQHGPAARIVSAERVISPGIAGLFAGDRYEAIVEVLPSHEVVTGEVVPDPDVLAGSDPRTDAAADVEPPAAGSGSGTGMPEPAASRPASAASRNVPPAAASRPGQAPVPADAPSHQLQGAAIAALLEEADAAELNLHRPGSAGVSTESPDFAQLLEQLGAGLRAAPVTGREDVPVAPVAPIPASPVPDGRGPAPAPPRETVPVLLSGVGDLVVLIGLGDDALDAALAMSMAAGGADVRTAGKLTAYGHLHVDGRQSATAARAHAVLTDQTVLVAFGLGKARDTVARLQSVAAISADQLWVVVDAGRKQEDTARWVKVLASQLNVTAVAVVGAEETATPETVRGLGLPVGWVDSDDAAASGI